MTENLIPTMLPRIVNASKSLRIYNRFINRCVHIGNANVIGTPIDNNDPEYQVIWPCFDRKEIHFLHLIILRCFTVRQNTHTDKVHCA